MKIAFFDTKEFDRESFERYDGQQNLSFKFYETKLNEDTVDLARGADAVCVFVNDTINQSVIDRLCEFNVRLIALRCSGFNNVDLRYAYDKIKVVRVPSYSPYAVAEHAMALLLTSIRRIHKAYIRTKDFNFSLNGLMGFALHGKTVGIVGTGKIGRVFADICKGFGTKILAFDKKPSDIEGVQYVCAEELFAQSDIISLHCPLTEETKHLINADNIKTMKDGVVIINTSRGSLIDSEALLEGIKNRKIGAACLDVYEEESDLFFEDFSGHIVNDDVLARLITMPNVLVTSHQAFLTEDAVSNIAQTTVNNIVGFFENNALENEIYYNPESSK